MTTWRIPASPLTGGVSRQPEPTREANQMQEADNVNLFIQRGVEKRFGTVFVNSGETPSGFLNVTGDSNNRWKTHFIDRSGTEKFVVMIDDKQPVQADKLQVFNLDGKKRSVNIDSTPTLSETGLDLTDGNVLITATDEIVVSDYFYDYAETGDAVTYSTGGGTAPAGLTDSTVYYIIKSSTLNRVMLAATQPDALAGIQVDITGLAAGGTNHGLATTIPSTVAYLRYGESNAKDKFRIVSFGDTVFVVNKEAPTYTTGTAPVYSPLSAQAELKFPNNSVNGSSSVWNVGSFIHLVSAQEGFPVGFYEIIADPRNGGDQEGPWYKRVPSPYDGNDLEPGSFPVRLVYDSVDESFTLSVIEWSTRLSGDEVTNPGPGFIGSSIKDLAILEDRLWFAAGPYVFASQAGDLFNLWIDDWTNVVDSDPIDLLLSGDDIHTADFIIPFSKTLVVFSDGGQQFEVKSNNAFTPKDTNIIPTTKERVSSAAYPVQLGQQLYFVSDQGDFSHVWEYFYDFQGDSNVAVNASLHADAYLPAGISSLKASENNGVVICHSEKEKGNLYVLFTYWNVSEKVQSAWCRWVYDDNNEILGFNIIDNRLYMLLYDGVNAWLEYQPVAIPNPDSDENGSIDFRLHMDRKMSLRGVFNTNTKQTVFTLPFLDNKMDTVVLGAGFEDKKGMAITATVGESGGFTTLSVNSDISEYVCFIGKSYNMLLELSKVYPKDNTNQVIFSAFQILFMDLYLRDTTLLDISVTPPGRRTRTTRYISLRTGSAVLGVPSIAPTARKRVFIRGRGSDTKIELKNSTPFQSEVTSMEFVGDLQAGVYQPTATGG